MSPLMYIIVSVMCLTSYSYCQSTDPCDTYEPIPEIHRRDASYTLSRGEESINDRNIKEGWYGNISVALLSKAPGFYKCGGWYPIWRTESDPDGRTASLCVRTSSELCANPFDIEVRQCPGIEIYKLRIAPRNRASYCFEVVPDEVVPDDPPEFSVKPTINVHLNHEPEFTKMLFRCEFSPSEDEDLFYNTFWFVEGTPLEHVFEPSKWNDDYLERTTLTEDLLKASGIMKPGFNLQCSVRAQYRPGRAYSTSKISDRQFVGIKINVFGSLTLEEGQTTRIPLQMTVPFGCGTDLDSLGANCVLDVEVGHFSDEGTDCKPTVVTENACGIEPIKKEYWNNVTHLTVVGQISSTIDFASKISHIKFKTPKSMDYLPFWQDYEIGNVAMTVTKDSRRLRNKFCSATNDPYIRRFGVEQYHYLKMEDVFTLYKDNDESRPIEVQIETEKCDQSSHNPYCTCGVAVRAGGTVFEISHCHSDDYHIRYTACRDGEDVLQVRKNGPYYYIHLPSGTVIDVALKSNPVNDLWWINVWLYPTVGDEGMDRGMCGNVASPNVNVFTKRDETTTTSFTEFAKSWSVSKEESLFNLDFVKEIESSYSPKYTYCTCEGPEASKALTCSVRGESHQCSLPRGVDVKPKKCAVPARKRRAVHYKPLRKERQAIISQTWNESAAIEYCEARFLESNTVQTIKEIPGANVWIEQMKTDCVNDIKNSETTIFSAMAVAGVRMYAMHEAMVNPVLRQNNVTNPSEPTLFDKITLQTCQADCNGKGSCRKGDCECIAGYGGSDCSIDLSTPPVVTDTEDGDHCDRASGDCQVLSVFGQIFSGEKDAKCRIRKNEIKSTGETERSNVTSSAAVSESISEVECTLPEADPAEVVTAYFISVSNAGDVYSNEITVLVYDSTCVTVNNETRAWTVQNGYCIYKGKCSVVGDSRIDNPSVKCVNTNGVSSWKTTTEVNPDALPPFNVKPLITVDLQHEQFVSKLLFRCNFTRSTEDLFYKTIWYVDGKPVYTFEPMEWTDDSTDYIGSTTLTEELLAANNVTKAGFNLNCAVRAQYHLNTGSSESELSDHQFVGVKIYSWNAYAMAEGETRQLYVSLTVPFGCGTFLASKGQKCAFNLEVVTVKNPDDCTSAVVTETSCGIQPIWADNWEQKSYLTFVGKITSTSGESSSTAHLKLKTPDTNVGFSSFWGDYEIGQVTIQIVKNTSSINYKYCSSTYYLYEDTFDYIRYTLDVAGVYTMYKDESRNIEVQIQKGECGEEAGWLDRFPVCMCGVVVRAGRTVFEISHCESPTWTIGYSACGDNGDVLQVKRYWDSYTIDLPTGISLYVNIFTWDVSVINVWLLPTVLDEGKSRGMCGVLSSTSDDDLTMRNGQITNSTAEFAESWRVLPDNNLFNPDVISNGFSSYKPVYQYCTCDESNPDDKTLTCSARAASEVCKTPAGFEDVKPKKCSISKRKKRMARYQQKRVKRQATPQQTWSNGWNEVSATEYCESQFAESGSVQIVKDVPGVNVAASLKDCVEDIKNSGGTNFTAMAVAGVRVMAYREAMVNPVLSEADPDNPSAATIFDMITLQTCQGDCNGRGSCNQGKCSCDAGYGGGDCSVDLTAPPVVYDTDEGGHCDLASGDCVQTAVIGRIFSGKEEAKCRIEKHTVKSTGETEDVIVTSSAAVPESISEVECTLPEAGTNDVVIALNISVSHAGDVYSNQLTVLVYDSSCVNVNHETRVWTLQDDYCTYKGKCILVGNIRGDNPCLNCELKEGVASWTQSTENGCPEGNLNIGDRNTASDLHVGQNREVMTILLLLAFAVLY